MRTFSIFCVFLFFSGFAFGQKVTIEIQIIGIDESPSRLEEIIIYDSSIDSIVFYNENYEKSSLLADLDTTHLYVFYGQANVRQTTYSLRDSLKLTNLDTIRTYEIYTVYDVCIVGLHHFILMEMKN